MRVNGRFSRTRFVAGAAAVLLAIAVVGCGSDSTTPAPSGPAHGAWVATGLGTVTLQGDGITAEPSVTYSLAGNDVYTRQTWTLSTTAPRAATVTLPFTYAGFHAWFSVEVFVDAFVTRPGGTQVDSVIAQGPVICCDPPSGGFNLSQSATFTVEKGDEYGFRFGGRNGDTDARLQGTFSLVATP